MRPTYRKLSSLHRSTVMTKLERLIREYPLYEQALSRACKANDYEAMCVILTAQLHNYRLIYKELQCQKKLESTSLSSRWP